MTNTRLELCNMIRMEAEHVSDTGFPLDVFSAGRAVRHTRHGPVRELQDRVHRDGHAVGGIGRIGRHLPHPHQRRVAEQRRPLHHPRGQAGTGQDTAAGGGIPPHTEARLRPVQGV